MRPLLAAAIAGLLSGCGTRAQTSPIASTPAPLAASLSVAENGPLAPLEQRLLAAHTLRIRMRLASDGAISSHFTGTLVFGEGQRVRADFQGDMGARPVDLRLVSDGTSMRGGSKEHPFAFDAAPAMREGLVLEFVRMGLLHEVALLFEGRPPAHIDGTVRSWIKAAGVAHEPGEAIRGQPTDHWTWALVITGGTKAEEDVWMDASTGLPVRRRMVVHFPEGDMHVGEEYDEVTLDAPVDEMTFAGSAPEL